MKKVLITIDAALIMCVAAYQIGNHNGMVTNQEINDKALAESPMCQGDVIMENFVLDVVDESEFWECCDSTAFADFAENSSEWYFAVCLEYARMYK